ncbi:MAG: glycosyltransferase family 4 protein [Chloroflexota bacterium]|nr:MAG: glycosyltransferase family 4 protein [Chloroflexota bacterium]
MKVLMISKACYVAAYRRKLEEMARLGIELTLLVPPFWRFGARRALLEEGNTAGYRLVVENPLLNGQHHWHAYRGLGGLLRRLKPDLVHVDEEPYDLVSFHATLLARRAGAKVVFFTWQNIDRDYPLLFGLFDRYVMARSAGAICGNQSGTQILRRKGFVKPLTVIPQFGVDPEVFYPLNDWQGSRRAAGTERPYRIGYVGRLVPEKGLMSLLQALAELEGNWQLEMLGEGPLRDKLAEASASLGIGERVNLHGGVPSNEVPAFVRGLDTLVLPSLTISNWKEQFGRVIVEAMASAVPVVGSDSGEIPIVIGDVGLVFPEGDAAALRAHLRRLMTDLPLRLDLSTRSRQRAMDCFTQASIAEQTCAFYRRVMGG